MNCHLSECKEEGQPNRRNSKLKKTMKTSTGSFELEAPRDREGSFEPELVKKRQIVLNESLDNKVLSLYAAGISYGAITEHLADMYGLEISSAKISLITDKLMPVITEWRNPPLEAGLQSFQQRLGGTPFAGTGRKVGQKISCFNQVLAG